MWLVESKHYEHFFWRGFSYMTELHVLSSYNVAHDIFKCKIKITGMGKYTHRVAF
jgi:hypothetical protein